jgi:hypothetical protein
MNEDEIVSKHRGELSRGKFPIYDAFLSLERGGLPPETLRVAHDEVRSIVELAIEQGLTTETQLISNIDFILHLDAPEVPKAFRAWRLAVASARPFRKKMKRALDSFREWIEEAGASVRPQLFDLMPKMAGPLIVLQESTRRELFQTAQSLHSSDEVSSLLAFVVRYGTSETILLSACAIGCRAVESREFQFLERIASVVSPKQVEQQKDAARLFEALAVLSAMIADKQLWSETLDLILALASKNLSSAFHTAKTLHPSQEKLSLQEKHSCIRAFHGLVCAIGIRVIGFGLEELPKMIKQYGADKTERFVSAAIHAANAYGTNAGTWFLDRRTTAAREMLRDS